MNSQELKSIKSQTSFVRFWETFQPLPFQWASAFISQSRYLLLSVAFTYLLLTYMTFFPNISGFSEEAIRRNPILHQVTPLLNYPSLNIIFLGWVAVIILTVRWRHNIPVIFQWIWENDRLGQRNEELKKEYLHFLQGYQQKLLEKKNPLVFSFLIVMLFFSMIWFLKIPQFFYFLYSPIGNLIIFIIIAIILFWIFLIGLVGWLLIITSIYIGKITRHFSVQIQPSHPDKCGGLKPLGDFFISTIMPLIVGGIFLTLLPILQLDNLYIYLTIISTFALFLVAVPLTILVIYLAFWNIHLEMIEHKRVYTDKIAEQIVHLENEILLNTKDRGKLVKAKDAKEKLEILQTLHPDKISYPVWPFKFTNTAILAFSPQIIQTLVGIITTIYTNFFK